jgi:hypothetical protein
MPYYFSYVSVYSNAVMTMPTSQANNLPQLKGDISVNAQYSSFNHVHGDQTVIDNCQYSWKNVFNFNFRPTLVISPLAVILMTIGACTVLVLG